MYIDEIYRKHKVMEIRQYKLAVVAFLASLPRRVCGSLVRHPLLTLCTDGKDGKKSNTGCPKDQSILTPNLSLSLVLTLGPGPDS